MLLRYFDSGALLLTVVHPDILEAFDMNDCEILKAHLLYALRLQKDKQRVIVDFSKIERCPDTFSRIPEPG